MAPTVRALCWARSSRATSRRTSPLWDKGKRDNGTLSRADFGFEPERDLYICPRGHVLKTTGKVHDGRTLLYRASKSDCDPCPLKLRCCAKEPARKIPRDVNEAARDLARGLMRTEGCRVSARPRKMIETGFADMKRNLGLTRLRPARAQRRER